MLLKWYLKVRKTCKCLSHNNWLKKNLVSDILAISRSVLAEICSCKFFAFFRVYITSEEFGQPDRKTTKQVWQVGLVAAFVTTSCSAVSDECPNTNAYRRQQTEQGTSCSNHWMETIRLNKDLFMLHIHPAWKIPTAHTTVTHLVSIVATQLVDPLGLGDQLNFICNYCGFRRLWKQDNGDKTIVVPHSVSNWCSSFVLCYKFSTPLSFTARCPDLCESPNSLSARPLHVSFIAVKWVFICKKPA